MKIKNLHKTLKKAKILILLHSINDNKKIFIFRFEINFYDANLKYSFLICETKIVKERILQIFSYNTISKF